jgi:hypothetical protein
MNKVIKFLILSALGLATQAFPAQQSMLYPGAQLVSIDNQLYRLRLTLVAEPTSFDRFLNRAGTALVNLPRPVKISIAGAAVGLGGYICYRVLNAKRQARLKEEQESQQRDINWNLETRWSLHLRNAIQHEDPIGGDYQTFVRDANSFKRTLVRGFTVPEAALFIRELLEGLECRADDTHRDGEDQAGCCWTLNKLINFTNTIKSESKETLLIETDLIGTLPDF